MAIKQNLIGDLQTVTKPTTPVSEPTTPASSSEGAAGAEPTPTTKVDGRHNNNGRPKKPITRKVVMIRLEESTLAQIDAIARAENASRTTVIDAALKKAIEGYGKPKQRQIF